jgi:AcrR family transcriptional regulator
VRERIVRSARRLFNRNGFESTSVDAIMAEAGLTRGGFYSYFRTKEELYAESIRNFLTDMQMPEWNGLAADPKAFRIVESIINGYLSDAHVDNIDNQCPLIGQPNDVARSGEIAKAAYREILQYMLDTIAKALNGSGHSDPDLPYAMAAMLIGSMTLARTVGDKALGRRIRDASRRQALRLAQPPHEGAGKAQAATRRANGSRPRAERATRPNA